METWVPATSCRRRHTVSAPQPRKQWIQLRRAGHAREVPPPALLRQHEGVQLVAADRAVAAHLVLEVHLRRAVESAEDHQVARALEAIEPAELTDEHCGVVVPGQELARG